MPSILDELVSVEGLKAVKAQENGMIADEYSSSKTYALGAYCYKSGTLYKCTTPITTSETWDSSHWTAAKIATDIGVINDNSNPFNASEFTRKFLNNNRMELMSLASPSATNKRSVILDHNRIMQTVTASNPSGTTFFSFLITGTPRYLGATISGWYSTMPATDFIEFECNTELNLYLKTSIVSTEASGTTADKAGMVYVLTRNPTTGEVTYTTVDVSSAIGIYRYFDAMTNLNRNLPALETNKNIAIVFQSRVPKVTSNYSFELFFKRNDTSMSVNGIAAVQNPSTAIREYTTGSYFLKQDKLHKVTAAISSGEEIVLNTNAVETTVGDELKTLFESTEANRKNVSPFSAIPFFMDSTYSNDGYYVVYSSQQACTFKGNHITLTRLGSNSTYRMISLIGDHAVIYGNPQAFQTTDLIPLTDLVTSSENTDIVFYLRTTNCTTLSETTPPRLYFATYDETNQEWTSVYTNAITEGAASRTHCFSLRKSLPAAFTNKNFTVSLQIRRGFTAEFDYSAVIAFNYFQTIT